MSLDATIITICWNAGATIQRTLNSVLAQSTLPKQYLVVDGGSQDATLEILAAARPRFEAAGIQFCVLPQQRVPGEAGIPNAWNQALRQATGDFIAILNADDWYETDVLSDVTTAFQKTDADAVVMPIRFIDSDGKVVRVLSPQPFSRLPWKMVLPHPGTFFRKRVYDRLGLYNPAYRISADYDFIWRCHQAQISWHFLEAPKVNMQAGGLADTGRKTARRETYTIARHYTPWYDLRPIIARILRSLTSR